MKGLKNMAEEKGEILIYSSDDGVTKIDVRLEDETVWLTQQQLADLYHTSKSNVSEHITNIFKEGELDEAATVRKFRTVQIEGGRNVERNLLHYNLDNILTMSGEKLLEGNGSVSHQKAIDKVEQEYKKYQAKTLSSVEKDYLETIESLGKIERKGPKHS